MIFELPKNVMIKKINKLKCAVSNFVNVYVENGILYVEVSNNEIYARVSLLDNVDDDIKVTLSNHFIQMMDKLPGDKILFNFGVDSLKINCGTSESILKYIENKNSNFKYELGQELRINDLRNILKKTSISVAKSNAGNILLTGINFKVLNDQVMIRSTDRFRISQYKNIIDNEILISSDLNINIPNHNFIKVLDAVNDDFKLYNNKTELLVLSDDTVYVLRLLEGAYPNVENYIPEKCCYTISFNKSEIIDILDRCSIFCETGNDYINLKMHINEMEIIKSSSIGSLLETIGIECNFSEDLSIALSLNYLKAAINSYDSERIKITFNSPLKPILIYPGDDKDNSFVQLMLPVKVTE